MGIGDLVNSGLGKLEHGVDAGKKLLGEGIDKGTDLIGDGLDYVGAHDWADKVEDLGDNLASDLGATPGEQQLGQTDQANELVHGNVSNIRATAKHLTDFGTAFDKVGGGMRGLDSAQWKGEAADTFREKFAMHPPKWLHAADACDAAGKALESYADTVKWAQGQAQQAIDLYKRGKKASEQAVESYNKKVDAYNAAIKADKDPGPPLERFVDPGRSDIARAREILAEARRQRNEAGGAAAGKVTAALEYAPAEPPPLNRLVADGLDGYTALNTEILHVGGGVIKGSADLVNFVRGLNPEDPYNITHPAAYVQNVNMTLAGLVSTAAHPERVPSALIDSFKKDPSEFVGRLIPQLVGTDGLGLAEGGLRIAAKEGLETSAASMASNGLKYGDELAGAEKAAAGAAPKDWSDLARSTDHVSEKAIHADSVDPKLAQEFLDDQYPWLKDVNNRWEDGYTQNCAYTTVTVDGRLDGIEASAARREGPGHLPLEPLGVKDPATAWHKVDSYDDVIRDLQARGEGSRSAIFIGRGNSGHFFNAVNTEHGVVFLDGQSGKLGLLESDAKQIMHVPYGKGAP
ncbi:toxin glutamine deamidase domain-containing protein [Streptomyces sp. NBC_01239]|uniref:putative T7SS-secreted protein n=1 Tax=Streptomyces sp. NBC_01239 TaxID=2903792 RepID=UPI00225850E7|nr:toxin glutamine deamidase domain-containing protein [Streptomyces sp. NBC_01239]MCX4814289.1 toxin glutamine deamidase domain-containing protein [Streptomyces sp. NBC_01239]